MPATKKQPAKQTKVASKPQEKPARKPKAAPAPEPVAMTRAQEAHAIQAVMHGLTVEQIVEQTGLTLARVENHVAFECGKGRSRMKGKQVQVIKYPKYRTA